MNPRMNDGGLSLPLRTDLSVSRSTTGRDNRLHDGSPGDIDGGVAISVLSMSTGLTDKGGLTLAVRFGTVSTLATGARRVARVYRVQGDTSKSSLVGEKETQLSK